MGCCGHSSSGGQKQDQKSGATKVDHPLDILKIRLAKGEISFEDYEKAKALLAE